jgi:acetyl-CoA synthetase
MSPAEFAWHPSPQTIEDANWTAFMRGAGVRDFAELTQREAQDPCWFWSQIIRCLDFRFDRPYTALMDASRGAPFTQWCKGGTTNLVLNALDKWEGVDREREAIVWEGEEGTLRRWSVAELDREVCQVAAGLAALGVRPGDCIGIYMPTVPETAAAFLAIVKIGCIALPLFSGFGPDAIASRLAEGGASVVFTTDSTLRRGQTVHLKSMLDEALERLPQVRKVIVVPRFDAVSCSMTAGRDLTWKDLTAGQPERHPTLMVDAEAPMLLMFTSGTTGRPKGAVHSHCGLSIKAAMDCRLVWDFHPGDRLLWLADFGWLAGPMYVIGTLLNRTTFLMLEGVPDYPIPGRYWRSAQDLRATILGLAPTLARSLRRHGDSEVDRYDLSAVRVVPIAGEPCDADTWRWIFEHVCRRQAPILNLSGGTEIGGGIVASNILFPIKPGSFHGPIPGSGADIVDASGASVSAGEVGELVMRRVSIGLTRSLWKDEARYLDSYWSQIPGMWIQGDLATRDPDGCWFLLGRSDDTLKVAGKRAGPSEIEELLIATHLVSEVAVVGVPDGVKGTAVVCVAIAAPNEPTDAALARKLSDAVVGGLGSAFRPKRILFTDDLPRTRNMKILRRVVRAALTGTPAGDLSSLLNPGAVEALQRLANAQAA